MTMKAGDEELFKVSVNVPEEYLEKMMDSINSKTGPVYPGYDRTFGHFRVTGTWRPLAGSRPFKGTIGEIEAADEIRLEFIVRGKDLGDAVKEIVSVHPYEEPAIDIVRTLSWKEFV